MKSQIDPKNPQKVDGVRYVLFHDVKGIYLGQDFESGTFFWSLVNPGRRVCAPTFTGTNSIPKVLQDEYNRSDYMHLCQVGPDLKDYRISNVAVTNWNLPTWIPESA